ncbi:hypothetical protein XENTR_v10010268 [Xenopus tropicalis]|nr:hypothetical protein XENTR_v10010268 [Xenopus tropicalis]
MIRWVPRQILILKLLYYSVDLARVAHRFPSNIFLAILQHANQHHIPNPWIHQLRIKAHEGTEAMVAEGGPEEEPSGEKQPPRPAPPRLTDPGPTGKRSKNSN